jgi:hypothetical protein
MKRNLPFAVVPGAAVWPRGHPSPTRRRRAARAAALWRAGALRGIVACGGLGRHPPPAETTVIARLCRQAGMPGSALLLEADSTTTESNLRTAAALLQSRSVRVLVVTDTWHVPRALQVARRAGLRTRAVAQAAALRAVLADAEGAGARDAGIVRLLADRPRALSGQSLANALERMWHRSDDADLVQHAGDMGRQRFLALPVGGQVVRRVFGPQVTPALKRPLRNGGRPDNLGLQTNGAARDSVLPGDAFEPRDALAALDEPLYDPVDGPASQKRLFASWPHAGEMDVLPVRPLGGPPLLPVRDGLDAVAADAELDQVQMLDHGDPHRLASTIL